MREYQRLETGEGECGGARSAEVYYTGEPMSLGHRAAFAASIVFCISVVVSFLWLLPCDLATCPSHQPAPPPNVPWDRTLYGLELVGGVRVVGGRVVVVGASGAVWGPSHLPSGGGVVALAAAHGADQWWVPTSSPPTFLSCPPQDAPVCFLLVPPASLQALHPLEGTILWKAEGNWKQVERPVLVPDSNKDGYTDLAAIVRNVNESYLVAVVSGKSGRVMNTVRVPDSCVNAANLTFDQGLALLKYNCSTHQRVVEERVPVSGVVGGGGGVGGGTGAGRRGAARHTSPARPPALSIEYSNSGSCPGPDCLARLTVRGPHATSLWNRTERNVLVMRPIPLRFKPNINGFLLKLWHWHAATQNQSGLRVESIKERIVLITFDSKANGNHSIVNASQTDITRLCNVTEEETLCQPAIHTDTALIADVNGDGSQELVSYYVTYRPDSTVEPPGWQLESRIKVVRLEAEVAKLYEGDASH